MTDSIVLPIANLRRDGGTQPRSDFNREIAIEYAEAMSGGAVLPAVTAFYDGTDHWLADGFHRVAAHEYCDLTEIEVDVRQGSRRGAILFSVGANAQHGYRRSQEDRRRAVLTLLNDPEWSAWSDREIARRCRVDGKTVAKLRPPATAEFRSTDIRTFQKTDGTVSHMRVDNIGKRKPHLPVIAGFQAERRPQPDAAGLQEEIGVGFASAITGLSERHVKELAREGKIEGAERTGSGWIMPTAAVVELVEQVAVNQGDSEREPDPISEYDHDAGREILLIVDAIETIAQAPGVRAFLERWRAELGAGIPCTTVSAAGAWMTEFSRLYPEIEAARQERLAAMLERIEADVLPG